MTDDTVLEEHYENPDTVQMRILGEGGDHNDDDEDDDNEDDADDDDDDEEEEEGDEDDKETNPLKEKILSSGK